MEREVKCFSIKKKIVNRATIALHVWRVCSSQKKKKKDSVK